MAISTAIQCPHDVKTNTWNLSESEHSISVLFAHKEDAYNVPLAQRSCRPNLELQRSKAHQEVAKAPFSSVIRHKKLGTEDSQTNEELEIRAELLPRSQPQPRMA